MLIVVYISLSFNKFVAISLKKYYLTMKQIEISCNNSVEASRNRDEVQIYFNGRYFDWQKLKLAGPWKRLFLLVSENIGPSTEKKTLPVLNSVALSLHINFCFFTQSAKQPVVHVEYRQVHGCSVIKRSSCGPPLYKSNESQFVLGYWKTVDVVFIVKNTKLSWDKWKKKRAKLRS